MKKINFLDLLITFYLIGLLLLVACKKDLTSIPPKKPQKGTITGFVKERHHQTPISGAIVLAVNNKVTDTTDISGYYNLERLDIGVDTLLVEVEKYHPQTKEVLVTADTLFENFNMLLTPENKDYDWIVENSPYIITDDYIIDTGDTLTIEPGVTAAFYTYRKLIVRGTLLAIGTEMDSIIFTVEPDPNFIGYKYHWLGVRFDTCSSDTRLEYCIFDRYWGTEFAIYCDNSSPTFSHCVFPLFDPNQETGGGTICCLNDASPRIEYCFIEASGFFGSAIACTKSDNFVNQSNSNPILFYNDIYVYRDAYAVVAGGFLDGNYINYINVNLEVKVDTSLGNPIDEIGDGIFTTTSGTCINVDGITNPAALPNHSNN